MYKDIVISILGALILEPVLSPTDIGEQIAIVMGLAAMLFIFCIFCEILSEKWQDKRRRTRNMEQRLERLKGGGKQYESRESARNYRAVGTDTVAAIDDAG